MSVLTCHPSKWSFQSVCIWRQVLQRFCSFDLHTLSYPESLFTFLPSFKFFPHLRDDFTFLCLLCLLLPSARDSFSYCQMLVTHFRFIFHFLLLLHTPSQPSLHRVWWPLKLQTTSSPHNSVSSGHRIPVRVPTHSFLHSMLWPRILFLLELVVDQKALVSHSSLDSLL